MRDEFLFLLNLSLSFTLSPPFFTISQSILPPSISLNLPSLIKKRKIEKLTSSSFPLFNIFKQEISSLKRGMK